MSDNEIEEHYNDNEEEEEEQEEEQEEYEYSDNENDDEIIEQQSLFNIPDSSYKILDYKEVSPIMESYIQEVSNLLSISHDISHILLKYYKWNKEKLIDLYYGDTEQILINAGASKGNNLIGSSSSLTTSKSSSSKSQSPSSSSSSSSPIPLSSPINSSIIKCRICGDNFTLNQVYELDCGHKFCRDCYGTYLIHQINDGPSCVFAHCPEYQCKQSITMGAVSTLCSHEVNEKYLMYLTRNFIETSTYMRWCPSPGCERVAIGSGITTVRCLCNFPFCFRCGQEAHDPSTCSQLASWQEKCNNESETANWILANTKKCPKCQTRIEKNQGCNHMNCKMCKHEFCWICMGSWAEHGQNTGGYYKCNKYVPNAEDSTIEKAKAELDRYLHYYQRYHGHDSALSFAATQRANAERKMMELQESEKNAWVDVQFLKQAVEQVIECRRVLKYTYVLGHYLKDGTAEKELYEHHQEMLEKHTERLSELTEIKSTFTESDRAHVVNLTRVTEKFMNSMLNTAMDDTHHVMSQINGGGKESTP